MEILLLLIPLSTMLIGIAVGAFVWAVRAGQFEDDAGDLGDDR
jgi:cbb3-type cytochrome oxidase maturation protein